MKNVSLFILKLNIYPQVREGKPSKVCRTDEERFCFCGRIVNSPSLKQTLDLPKFVHISTISNNLYLENKTCIYKKKDINHV